MVKWFKREWYYSRLAHRTRQPAQQTKTGQWVERGRQTDSSTIWAARNVEWRCTELRGMWNGGVLSCSFTQLGDIQGSGRKFLGQFKRHFRSQISPVSFRQVQYSTVTIGHGSITCTWKQLWISRSDPIDKKCRKPSLKAQGFGACGYRLVLPQLWQSTNNTHMLQNTTSVTKELFCFVLNTNQPTKLTNKQNETKQRNRNKNAHYSWARVALVR